GKNRRAERIDCAGLISVAHHAIPAADCWIRRNRLNRLTKAHCLDLLHGSLPRTYLNPFSAN
ncbi:MULTISPECIES: hypothetical protein, partial [Citrobacter]|uniref:hypothetical protein n=1 Tax=Citrobacter TaxID=544 RepID=UPI001BAFE1F1